MNKDSLSPFKRLLIQSQELSQYRLSNEYKAQVNKNNQLLTMIENDWKAFGIAFNEAVKNRENNLTINQQKKPKFDIERIDSKIKILDSELRKTKKIIELEYTTKNNDFNF